MALQLRPDTNLIVLTVVVYVVTFFVFGSSIFTSFSQANSCSGITDFVDCGALVFGFIGNFFQFVFLIIPVVPAWLDVALFLLVPLRWILIVVGLIIETVSAVGSLIP